jgi:hypothetical protein
MKLNKVQNELMKSNGCWSPRMLESEVSHAIQPIFNKYFKMVFKMQENRTGQRCCCRIFYFVVISKFWDKIGTNILKCAIIRYNYNMKRCDRKRP